MIISIDWNNFEEYFGEYFLKKTLKYLKNKYEDDFLEIKVGDFVHTDKEKYKNLSKTQRVFKWTVLDDIIKFSYHYIVYNTSSPFALFLCNYESKKIIIDDDSDSDDEIIIIKKKDISIDEKKKLILKKHKEIISKAEKIYGPLPKCDVKFSDRLKRSIGYYSYNKKVRGKEMIRYSTYHIKNNFNYFNNTIPHEIAHFVCDIYKLGKNHDKNWKKVCILLGGDGHRCVKKKNR